MTAPRARSRRHVGDAPEVGRARPRDAFDDLDPARPREGGWPYRPRHGDVAREVRRQLRQGVAWRSPNDRGRASPRRRTTLRFLPTSRITRSVSVMTDSLRAATSDGGDAEAGSGTQTGARWCRRPTIDDLGDSLDAPEVAWAARRDATPGLDAEPARDIRCLDLDPPSVPGPVSMEILSGNLPTALGGTSPAPIKPPLSGRGLTTITHERPGGTSKVTSMEVIGGTVPGETRPTDRIAPVGSSATIRVAGRGLLLATGMTKRRQPGSRAWSGTSMLQAVIVRTTTRAQSTPGRRDGGMSMRVAYPWSCRVASPG